MKAVGEAVNESLAEMLRQHYVKNRSLDNYFFLPGGRRRETFEYNNLLISMHRLSFPIDTMYGLATTALGYEVKNTAQEKDGTPYIGNINREEALRLNLALGNKTFNLRQFFDFKEYLESGKVYDGNGKIADNRIVESVWDEIFGKRKPLRGEHLDARFEIKNGTRYMHRNHRLINGVLIPTYSEPLEECLMEDYEICDVNINEQGMPVRKYKFEYCYPRGNSGVRFVADSDLVAFTCDSVSGPYPELGIRAVEIA